MSSSRRTSSDCSRLIRVNRFHKNPSTAFSVTLLHRELQERDRPQRIHELVDWQRYSLKVCSHRSNGASCDMLRSFCGMPQDAAAAPHRIRCERTLSNDGENNEHTDHISCSSVLVPAHRRPVVCTLSVTSLILRSSCRHICITCN